MEIEQVGVDEAISLARGESIVLDVREQYEWDAVHVDGATHVPMSELQARIAEVPTEDTLLVMCHSGQRSLVVTEALVEAGYHAVNVSGGIMAWELAGGPVVRRTPRSPLG
jgi:rhodanese-related sulfurtransferase